jgi:hypothetical protein
MDAETLSEDGPILKSAGGIFDGMMAPTIRCGMVRRPSGKQQVRSHPVGHKAGAMRGPVAIKEEMP